MSAVGERSARWPHYVGVPFFPMMTVYDFFIKRALDQLYYNLYWGAEFVVMGTPSGVTLAPEGAQHSWKSRHPDPEPRHLGAGLRAGDRLDPLGRDPAPLRGRQRRAAGVLIRAVTRGDPPGPPARQPATPGALQAGDADRSLARRRPGDGGLPEGEVPAVPDAEILAALREDVLAGGYLAQSTGAATAATSPARTSCTCW
jgi:pyruvate dehydrogenase E1 component